MEKDMMLIIIYINELQNGNGYIKEFFCNGKMKFKGKYNI